MSTYGVTDTGFVIKTFSDIISDIESNYQVRLEDNTYTLDFNTPEGIHSESLGYEIKDLWEQLLNFHNQMNIDTATGIYLDYFGNLFNLPRKSRISATGQVTITGTKNLVIPSNTMIKYAEKEYYFISNVVLDEVTEDSNVYKKIGFIQAVETGSDYNITSDVEFEFDYTGIIKVVSDTSITGGEDEETDTTYRTRLKSKKNSGQTATHTALEEALLELDVVKSTTILDPETTPATEAGTIKVFIDGTPDESIAKAIYNTKADGILTLKDDNTQSYSVKIKSDNFTRTIIYNMIEYDTIKIKVEVVEVKEEETKDKRWTSTIQKEILNYINNLNTGESISYLKLYSEILGIDDIKKIKLYIGTTTSNWKEQEFTKTFDLAVGRKWQINEEDITVNYVSE